MRLAHPYDRPGYAASYDGHYNLSAINRPHFDFEVATIERLIAERGVSSWCDVACGTGLHLRTVRTDRPIIRTGIDRSAAMLREARSGFDPALNLIEADIRDAPCASRHDLVTTFWYGYVHQESVGEVRAFLVSAASCVASGGTLLMPYCDPVHVFEVLPHRHDLAYGAPLHVDAIIWSFTEPWEGDAFTDCIAVHPELIVAWLGPLFERVEPLSYPVPGDAEVQWRRKALVFSGRRDGEPGPSGDRSP